MFENTAARVVWTGLVPSTSGRKSKRTGRLLEYRVVLLDDNTATCTCPAAIFQETQAPDSKPRPCTHIEIARRTQVRDAPEPSTALALTPGTTVVPGPAEASGDDFLSEFEDDTLLDLPQVRHDPRD